MKLDVAFEFDIIMVSMVAEEIQEEAKVPIYEIDDSGE